MSRSLADFIECLLLATALSFALLLALVLGVGAALWFRAML